MPGKNICGECQAKRNCALAFGTLTMTFAASGTATEVVSGAGGGTFTWTNSSAGTITLTRETYDPNASNASAGKFQIGQSECCCSCRWGILPALLNQVTGTPWVIQHDFTSTEVHTDTITPANNFTSVTTAQMSWLPAIAVQTPALANIPLITVADNSQPCKRISGVNEPVGGTPAISGQSGFLGGGTVGFPEVWVDPGSPTTPHVSVGIKVDGVATLFTFATRHTIGVYESPFDPVIGAIDPCDDSQDHVILITNTSSFTGTGSFANHTYSSSLTITAEFNLA